MIFMLYYISSKYPVKTQPFKFLRVLIGINLTNNALNVLVEVKRMTNFAWKHWIDVSHSYFYHTTVNDEPVFRQPWCFFFFLLLISQHKYAQ